jgi:hypothetical protein
VGVAVGILDGGAEIGLTDGFFFGAVDFFVALITVGRTVFFGRIDFGGRFPCDTMLMVAFVISFKGWFVSSLVEMEREKATGTNGGGGVGFSTCEESLTVIAIEIAWMQIHTPNRDRDRMKNMETN